MSNAPDPYAHHPELRGRIADPETSLFRTFRAQDLIVQEPHLRDWVYPEARREAIRTEALAGHAGDLWIFGYGSLMWNPALRFAEVRRANVADHARRLILVEYRGGRGTREAPGLMATLDAGDGCDGLAFRIAPRMWRPRPISCFSAKCWRPATSRASSRPGSAARRCAC